MSERTGYGGVEYYEFDFAGYIASAAAEARKLMEATYSHDKPLRDEMLRKNALEELVQRTNEELGVQGYLGRAAWVGANLTLPSLQEQAGASLFLQAGTDTTGELETVEEAQAFKVARYEGVALISEHLDGHNLELSRPQLCHKLLVFENIVETPFVNQSTRLYGYLRLEDESIEVFRPIVSYLQNERWLKGAAYPLFEDDSSISFVDLEDAYQHIKNATRSPVPEEKRLEWLYDQIEEVVELTGRQISADTSELLLQVGEASKYIRGYATLEGEVLGFCEMPVYSLAADGSCVEDSEKRQLALCMSIMHEGKECLAKVPVVSLLP